MTPHVVLTWVAADRLSLTSDEYLTDGRRLLRVVAPFDPRPEHSFAVLEDCLTLKVDTYNREQLATLPLRRVARGA
jgi:hypothetical protein